MCSARPCPHYRPLSDYRLRAWQISRNKGVTTVDKKLRLDDLDIKKGAYITSLSHVGLCWFEMKCGDKKKPEEYNGDVIDAQDSLPDAVRAKSMLPYAMAYGTLLEAIANALQNQTFPYWMIGKGRAYGPPYPPADDIDPVHLELLGELFAPAVVRPFARCSPA